MAREHLVEYINAFFPRLMHNIAESDLTTVQKL